MVKAHNKTRVQLRSMKVAELKALVRTYNLDNAIRKYSTMKKAELVEALMKHSSTPAAVQPATKKEAPKPKKAAPKTAVDEDDFFANIGKGKRAIAKTKLSAAHMATKKALAAAKADKKPAKASKKKKVQRKLNIVYESYFLERFRDILGEFVKLKETLLARKAKVASGQKAAIDEQVKRLDKFIKMDRYPGTRDKASLERFLGEPTSKELGFDGSETVISKTKKAVTAFIKAREKPLKDFIPLIVDGIKRHNKEQAEFVPKKETSEIRAARRPKAVSKAVPKTEAVSASSFRSGFGFGNTADRLSSMGISPLFAGLFK